MQRAHAALQVVPSVAAPHERVEVPPGEVEIPSEVVMPGEVELELQLDFDTLYRRYSPYVAAVAHRLLGQDAEVDDTVQEVFIAAVRGISQLRDPLAVKAWLARVAVRAARRKLRMRRMRSFLGLDTPAAYQAVADDRASPEQRALLARVYKVLDGIPTNQRIAWTLRFIEGEQLEAVAELCGCSLATAKRRIQAVSRLLEEAFAE
ncbi:MAG TPA: sigma-70 family RNA polymerase sigma factor [Polyangiaceae bacterium]|nr:sigma-70 family RNA polymerase sigma factor [Polyangiaceae bacterium]